jgi:hypothetical protein
VRVYTTQASDTTAPTVPTYLSGVPMSSIQVNLSWTASTDNTGGSGLAGYYIYRDGTQIATSAVPSYNNTGLSADTTYSYTVSAYDMRWNESAQSSGVTVTTLGSGGGGDAGGGGGGGGCFIATAGHGSTLLPVLLPLFLLFLGIGFVDWRWGKRSFNICQNRAGNLDLPGSGFYTTKPTNEKPMRNQLLFAVTFLLLILTGAHVRAQIIPPDRQIDWSLSGVPGGIPHRTTISTTIDASIFGNGTVDASQVINTALKNCPVDQVVFLPAGTYRLDNAIDFAFLQKVTLRGAGQGETILRPRNFVTSGYVSAIITGVSV